jgi:hypothetical protein
MTGSVALIEEPAADVEEPAPRRMHTRRSRLRLALESVLIVASVLLAFGLNEWRMQRADAHLVRNVIDGLHREIAANLALMEIQQPQHLRLAEAIASIDPSEAAGTPAFDVIMANRVDGGSLITPPAEAAWQTATSTGALRLLDYETVAILSRIYLGQRDAVGRTSDRVADLAFGGRMFDTSVSLQTVHTFLALMNELAAQEANLMAEYRAGLTRLEEIQ